ncbi:flagellar export protein FliJ [Aestuariirhabdus sp. Z084]|uniref:flagellar export protein FliJ n=1 Tax=Aestuariirhabdus haliotis TaxID=2918751 RepID=UPI00201B3DB6|nr:flagellar export protein FliJ [Aestuariirhabdus haliotis]MCL6414465.1 flagellar export protein FliJ [Aestuariirhabdus haliotis]MCL6418553.1 flagellar export protein FliJ [Aestuariirhabdus haliotis]
MKRSTRMDTVLQVTAADEEKAAQLFKQMNARLHEEQQKLEQLQSYQQEYHRQVREKQVSSVQQLQQMSQFIGKLSEAINEQQAQIERVNAHMQQLRQHWISARGRTMSITQLRENYLTEERRWEEQREQKEIDELVTTRSARGHNIKR